MLLRAPIADRMGGVSSIIVGTGCTASVGFGAWPGVIAIGAVLVAGGERWLRVAVVADAVGEGVVVRNRFRNRRVLWRAVVAVDYALRPMHPFMWRAKSVNCGCLTVDGGALVWIDAAESFNDVFWGRSPSRSEDLALAKVASLTAAWHGAVARRD